MTRWKAAGIHLVISAVVVGTLVSLLLLTWYPPAFVRMGRLATLVLLIGAQVFIKHQADIANQ